MSLFNRKSKAGDDLLYQTSYMGFWIKVYPDRVDFKAGAGSESIPINQIASVHQAMMGIMKVTIETTGGKKYNVPTSKKKEVHRAIYDAKSKAGGSKNVSLSDADELSKLNDLKEKGILTQEEFDKKKKQVLGI